MFPEVQIPTQILTHSVLKGREVEAIVVREDLIHPGVSGNKWRKLQYNLEEAGKQGIRKILTFGGAYSNHIAATAAAGHQFDFETIGIIRGDASSADNPTLRFAQEHGMTIHFVTRARYRAKKTKDFLEELKAKFGNFYLIPEGGANSLGAMGCKGIASGIKYDFICVSCGTGTTLAGIVSGLEQHQKAIGFSALKGEGDMEDDIQKLLMEFGDTKSSVWHLNTDYHFGGYAKITDELVDFIREFKKESGILLDLVYTGKLFFGVFDLISKGYFPKGSKIALVHTGGQQGNKGFEERFGVFL